MKKTSIRDITLVALFTALMVIGAFIRIPLPWVPLTFQPFFCAFAGILLGARLGMLSQVTYIVLGLIGIPVFTQGGGLAYIFKPTFGFLIGFAAAAYVIGKVSESLGTINFKNTLISVMSGLVVIFAIGLPYLYVILHFYMKMPNVPLVSATIIPIIIKDAVLFVVVAAVSVKVAPLVRKAARSN